MRATRDIGKGFVDGDSFDEGREITEHVDGRIAKPLVVLEMTTDKDQLRTKLARPTPRHAAADSECFSLVGCGQNNSAANGNGFAAQGWLDQLFDRCIEGIEVGVKNRGCCVHSKAVRTSPAANPETASPFTFLRGASDLDSTLSGPGRNNNEFLFATVKADRGFARLAQKKAIKCRLFRR